MDAIARLVGELAAYEGSADLAVATDDDFARALFGEAPLASCLLATTGTRVCGLALWFPTFSTWTGRAGMWLEDLYVEPSERRRGHGFALMGALAATCRARGYARLEWSVLDWNEPALAFYRALDAESRAEWTEMRLSGTALADLARAGRAR